MIIKAYKKGTLSRDDETTYLQIGKGPLVFFSSDYIPAYIPRDAAKKVKDTFRSWQDKVLVLAQMIDDSLTILSISMEGRLADDVEMEHLCDNMGLPLASTLYSGPFNEDLMTLADQMLIRCKNSNILWRR